MGLTRHTFARTAGTSPSSWPQVLRSRCISIKGTLWFVSIHSYSSLGYTLFTQLSFFLNSRYGPSTIRFPYPPYDACSPACFSPIAFMHMAHDTDITVPTARTPTVVTVILGSMPLSRTATNMGIPLRI